LKRIIVISAVNIVEGGTLAVLKECLEYLSFNLADEYEVIVLVNNKTLFPFKNLKYLEFPKSKKHWICRLYYEYHYFFDLSKEINPYLWLSFQDITPNVTAERLALYCHNPSPFPPLALSDLIWGGYKFILFKLFYRFLYAFNINKNTFIILQQDCLRKKFPLLTGAKPEKIIVAYPTISPKKIPTSSAENGIIFFYPALPRVFKNFEVICKATKILLKNGINNFKVIFTISGCENRYSRHIYRSCKNIKNIVFLGMQSRDRIFELYIKSTCIIFSSKLETWGMPITEAKFFQKPIILANLEYARETVGSYDKVMFFDPNNHEQLADAMKSVLSKTAVFEKNVAKSIKGPFSQTWSELFNMLLHLDPSNPLEDNSKLGRARNV
jgi:glycosyltransferase involved in cell wall biosynthesis